MLEILRKEMIEAFNHYQKLMEGQREREWSSYCRAREAYLQYYAEMKNTTYYPLHAVPLPQRLEH